MSLLHPEEGKDGKTERATGKKKNEARKDGTVCMSNEIITVIVMAAAIIVFRLILPYFKNALFSFVRTWDQINVTAEWNVQTIHKLMKDALYACAICILPVGLTAIGASTLATIAQTKPYFEPSAMKLKFDSLNPVSGMKQLFSVESIIKLVISLLKVFIISLVVWLAVRSEVMKLIFLHRLNISEGVTWYISLMYKIIWRVLILFIIIAVIDWIKTKRKYEFNLMMTKQEVKDERKNQESNPQVKNKLRQKMRELSMSRMMAAVPDAAIVITNPTHLAIAIKYNSTMQTPIVIAKGKRLTAKRIREIARENGVPVVERKPLARALYGQVTIGSPVPTAYFEAVAGLLAYLYRIGNTHVRAQLGKEA